jgi:hypothetical protein
MKNTPRKSFLGVGIASAVGSMVRYPLKTGWFGTELLAGSRLVESGPHYGVGFGLGFLANSVVECLNGERRYGPLVTIGIAGLAAAGSLALNYAFEKCTSLGVDVSGDWARDTCFAAMGGLAGALCAGFGIKAKARARDPDS